MAREVAALVRVIEADEALKFELLNSVTWTQFLNCDVADAFNNVALQATYAHAKISRRTALMSLATVGVLGIVTGDHVNGRRDLRQATRQLRELDPVGYAVCLAYWCGLVSAGLERADDFVGHGAECVAMAEELGADSVSSMRIGRTEYTCTSPVGTAAPMIVPPRSRICGLPAISLSSWGTRRLRSLRWTPSSRCTSGATIWAQQSRGCKGSSMPT